MFKFKVGDLVKVTKKYETVYLKDLQLKVVSLEKVYDQYCVCLQYIPGPLTQEAFELVESAQELTGLEKEIYDLETMGYRS